MRPYTLLTLAIHDCKTRYAGSVLGGIWAVLSPIVTAAIYWFVYTVVLGGVSMDGIPYVAWLLCGIAPWFFFTESLNGAVTCFRDYRFLVCKVRFQREYLPLIRVCASLLVHLAFLALIYVGLVFSGFRPQWGQLWVLCWILGGGLLALGIGGICSVWCVYLHDVAYGIGVMLQLGFWLTPIFWNQTMLPDSFAWICRWNPMAILVQGYREALLYGTQLSMGEQVYFWGITLSLLVCSRWLLKSKAPTLADKL